jgi:hypothetical protein
MKRTNRRTLELVFARPTSANIKWRRIEALFAELGAEITEREGSRVAVFLFSESESFIDHILRRTRTKGRWRASEGGWSSMELSHERHELEWL